MHRFFVEADCIKGMNALVDGPVAWQIAKVLRLRTGSRVVLMDNSGYEYVVSIQVVSSSRMEGEILESRLGIGVHSPQLTLYQGILKGDKWGMVLQKCTEIGISSFVPIFCRRSVPKDSASWTRGKFPRWLSILTEAAEQCGSARIPTLEQPMSIKSAIACSQGMRLMAWEGEKKNGFREAIVGHMETIKKDGLSLFVGSEGGFDPEEVEEARDEGVVTVSLGRRVLRGETAGLVMASAVMYELGELGS